MEEVLARIFQFSIALIGAFTVALWFALVIWTYRDAVLRSRNPLMQVFSTLIVVLFFIPGVIIYMLLRPRETLDERQQRWIEEEYLAQELDDLAICPSCNHSVRDEWIYCPACRFQLRRACHACGRLVESSWQICAFCGSDLRDSAQPEQQELPHLSFDDHQLTVRSESWVAQRESAAGSDSEPLTTADGGGVMLGSDEPHPNGAAGDDTRYNFGETGELPVTPDTPALEGSTRRQES